MPYELNEMYEDDSNPLSDNLGIHNPETWDEELKAKIEAQRWCLGFHSNFSYHSVIDGKLLSNILKDVGPEGIRTANHEQFNTPNTGNSLILGGGPDWLQLAERERLAGVKEIVGSGSNPRISDYLKTVGLGSSDEIPWCSAFVNWVMERANYKTTGSGLARSWLNWGTSVSDTYGAIAILKRGSPPAGHVAFFLGRKGNKIILLGGNQSDSVMIREFPASDLIGLRYPALSDRR